MNKLKDLPWYLRVLGFSKTYTIIENKPVSSDIYWLGIHLKTINYNDRTTIRI